MRMWFTAVAVFAVVSSAAFASPARAADALTGKMALYNYLLGGPWSCTTKVPAMQGKPAHADQSTVRFEVVPGNALHDHVTASDYAGDDYFAFDSKSNMFWDGNLGSDGSHGYASSSNGNTYTGQTWSGKTPSKITTTYTKVSPTSVKVHVVTSMGGHPMTIDSACTR